MKPAAASVRPPLTNATAGDHPCDSAGRGGDDSLAGVVTSGGGKTTFGTFHLLDGAPRQAILGAIDVVLQVLDAADDLLKLLEMLTGDELTIRFDWNPKIANWALR